MNNCKYVFKKEGGGAVHSFPSSLISEGGSIENLINSLSEGINSENIKEIEEIFKAVNKEVILPETIKGLEGLIIGQNSPKNVARTLNNKKLKGAIYQLNKALSKFNRSLPEKSSVLGVNDKENILFATLPNDFDYEYIPEKDLIIINNVNLNSFNIIKGLLDRAAFLFNKQYNTDKSAQELISEENIDFLNMIGVTDGSILDKDYLDYIYFGSNKDYKLSILDNVDLSTTNYKSIKNSYAEKAFLDKREENYEPVITDDVFNLNQGDLVAIKDNSGVGQVITVDKLAEANVSYALFIDYTIIEGGEYKITVLYPNSESTNYIYSKTPTISTRKLSDEEKYKNPILLDSDDSDLIKFDLNRNKIVNNDFIFNYLKPGDFINGSKIKNFKGSNIITEKGTVAYTQIKSVSVSKKVHPELQNTEYIDPKDDSKYEHRPINSDWDKLSLSEGDVINYRGGELATIIKRNNKGRGIDIDNTTTYEVKNLSNDKIETIDFRMVTDRFINNQYNEILIRGLNNTSKEIIEDLKSYDNFNNTYITTDYNFIEYYRGFKVNRGDYLRNNGEVYLILNSTQDGIRVWDGKRYLNIPKDNINKGVIITKRPQDAKLAKQSILVNQYKVTDEEEDHPELSTVKVKVWKHKIRGNTRVEIDEKGNNEKRAVDYTLIKSGFSYMYPKGGWYLHDLKGLQAIEKIQDGNNFEKVFDDIVVGSFIKFKDDKKYWYVEKKVNGKLLISYSYERNGNKCVKKLIDNTEKVADLHLPTWATFKIDKIDVSLGNKEAAVLDIKDVNKKSLTHLTTLTNPSLINDYDSPELIKSMGDLLEEKYGIKVNYVHSSDFSDSDNLRAFVKDGEYYINIDRASVAEPLHELLHMVLASMKYSDYEKYEKLVSSISNHPLFKDITTLYDDVNLDNLEETFVKLFSETVRHRIKVEGVFNEQSFNNSVNLAISDLLNLTEEIEDESSFELLDTDVRDIMTSFGSNLTDNNESLYDKSNAIAMMKVSNEMSELKKSGNLNEKCDGM